MSVGVLFLIFFVLILLGMPIAFTMAVASLAYLLCSPMNLSDIAQKMVMCYDNYLYIAMPLFVLAGDIMNTGGITKLLINVSKGIVGSFRGALAHVNVVVSMLFGGIQGLSSSDTVAVGSILIPAMVEDGYDRDFSIAITVASSVLGAIIPPSLVILIYASVTNLSTGAMFTAGIVPGITLGLLQMAYITFLGRRHPETMPPGEKLTWGNRRSLIFSGLPVLMLPVIIVGGTMGGFVTPTETAILAVLYALAYSVVTRAMSFRELPSILLRSTKTVTSVMIILGTSSIFAYVLSYERVPTMVVDLMMSISTNKYVIILLVNLLLLILGMLMDNTPVIVVLAPIIQPLLMSYGLHPVHIGIIMCTNLIMGVMTPPVGVSLYLGASIGNSTVERVTKAELPLILINYSFVLLVSFVPEICLWLPKTIGLI